MSAYRKIRRNFRKITGRSMEKWRRLRRSLMPRRRSHGSRSNSTKSKSNNLILRLHNVTSICRSWGKIR